MWINQHSIHYVVKIEIYYVLEGEFENSHKIEKIHPLSNSTSGNISYNILTNVYYVYL